MNVSPAPEVRAWELRWLAGLLGFYLLADLLGIAAADWVNIGGPLWLVAVLLSGAAAAVRRDPLTLWTALFWMRVTTAIYFGLGSVAEPFMNSATHAELVDFYDATPVEIARFNLLAALCSLVILATVRMAARFWPAAPIRPATNDRTMALAALVFGTLGFPVKYLFLVPNAMGALGEDVVLPGLLTQFVWLAPVSIYLGTTWTLRHRPHWLPAIALAVALDSFAGVLGFSKADALLPLMMFGMAWLQHRFSFQRLAASALVAALAFSVLQAVVSDGRAQLGERHGTIRAATFPERLEILSSFIRNGPDAERGELQGSLMRIAYVHAAAPAMSLFDAGLPGHSLQYLAYLPVPRAIWPDKPIFDMAQDYTVTLTGSDTSSTWMGYFAEAYWNLGWLGVPVVMVPLGLIFFATGRYAFWVLRSGAWLHFPSVFLGMYMGARMDGLLVGDVAASVMTMLILHPVARLGTVVLREIQPAPKLAR